MSWQFFEKPIFNFTYACPAHHWVFDEREQTTRQTSETPRYGADGLACWFIDTDYNEERFFDRRADFLGAKNSYRSDKTTLKADIQPEAWESLHSDTMRAFDNPSSGGCQGDD